MLLGIDTGFLVAYANDHPRALSIWQELIDGLHTLVLSTLTIHEILIYLYRRGDGDKGKEWISLMVETDSIEVVPVTLEIAARSARHRHGTWEYLRWTRSSLPHSWSGAVTGCYPPMMTFVSSMNIASCL